MLLAFALIFGAAFLLHLGHKREEGLLPYIFYPVLLSIGVGALLSGRNLFFFDETMMIGAPPAKHAVVAWASRVATLMLLLVPFERIGHYLLAGRRRPAVPLLLLGGFLTFFVTNIVTSAFLSAHHSLLKDYFMFVGAGVAALLMSRAETETALRTFRNGVLVFMLVGAVLAPLRPELVMSHNYFGILPGVHIRYAGLSSHANSLGPLSVVFLLCLWHSPYANRLLTWFAWGLGLMTLLLTQSKSSYISFLLGIACLIYFQGDQSLLRRLLDHRRPHLPVALILAVLGGLALVCLAFMFGGLGDRIARFFGSSAGAELVSLTGRDEIWQIALKEWRRSPVFGYGLTIFDDAYRYQIHIPYAYHAHSQFYQSLASAGIVGFAGLIVYLATLLWFTVRTVRTSQGLSLALFVMMLSRSVSEVPMSLIGFGTEQMMQLLFLMVLSGYMRQRPAVSGAVATPATAPVVAFAQNAASARGGY
nr:O-antigen ligase family protein [Duganella vulcania]